MRLRTTSKLLKIWNYALDNGANVVLMRHAPKAGSDESDLSEEGKQLAKNYQEVLARLPQKYLGKLMLFHTTKGRTLSTLEILFPLIPPADVHFLADLEVNKVSSFVQKQVNELHRKIGRWRGYYLNHTYHFLEVLGGRFDEENLHTRIAERMVRGIKELFEHQQLVVYCGHSPAIEVACEKVLAMPMLEFGGFLNPLDSLHLKRSGSSEIELVARINPIVGYVDAEAKTYL